MKAVTIILMVFFSLSAFGKTLSPETLAIVKFYKDGKVVSDQFEIVRSGEKYTLTKNKKAKALMKLQADDLQSSINALLWKFEYKDAKHPDKCEKLYASLSVGEDTSLICVNESEKVQKVFALLNRLTAIAKKN